MADPTPQQPPAAPPGGVAVTITAQYVKDLSFESPNAPQIFSGTQSPPEISMAVNVFTRNFSVNSHEVALALKVEAKHDGKPAFIAELVYAGVFVLPPMAEEQLKFFLLVEAPRLLFPFARGIMATAIRDGGFPNIMINPIDFMGMFLSNKNNVGTMSTAGAA